MYLNLSFISLTFVYILIMIKIIEKEDINLISYLKVKLFEEKAKIVFETGVKQQIENTERLSAKNNLNEDLNKKTKK